MTDEKGWIEVDEFKIHPTQRKVKGELPIGYEDENGKLHKDFVMRLPTAYEVGRVWALDEPEIFKSIRLLAICIEKLGDIEGEKLKANAFEIVGKLYTPDIDTLRKAFDTLDSFFRKSGTKGV